MLDAICFVGSMCCLLAEFYLIGQNVGFYYRREIKREIVSQEETTNYVKRYFLLVIFNVAQILVNIPLTKPSVWDVVGVVILLAIAFSEYFLNGKPRF